MPTGSTAAVVLSALAAMALGAADFAGGSATRRARAVAVGAASQSVEAAILLVVILLVRPTPAAPSDLGFGSLAGVVGSFGLIALYEGLARGNMGVVAAISGAGSVAIPVIVGGVGGAVAPHGWQVAGIALAMIASLVAVKARPTRASRVGISYGLVAALGLGAYLVLINAGVGSMLWTLAASRVAAAVLLSVMALPATIWRFDGRIVGLVGIAASLDLAGNVLLVNALGTLPVGLVAAISGTYPVTTGILAWFLLRERLTWLGYVSVGLAVAGIVLIGQQ